VIGRCIKLHIEKYEESDIMDITGMSDDEVTFLDDHPEEVMKEYPNVIAPIEKAADVNEIVREHISRIIPALTEEIKKAVTSKLSQQSQKVVHECVRCDGCQKKPIVGVRYKCAICHDFDFCEECEAKNIHPHPFLKIRRPEQAPKSILVGIEDNELPGLDINGVHISEVELFGAPNVDEIIPVPKPTEPAN